MSVEIEQENSNNKTPTTVWAAMKNTLSFLLTWSLAGTMAASFIYSMYLIFTKPQYEFGRIICSFCFGLIFIIFFVVGIYELCNKKLWFRTITGICILLLIIGVFFILPIWFAFSLFAGAPCWVIGLALLFILKR